MNTCCVVLNGKCLLGFTLERLLSSFLFFVGLNPNSLAEFLSLQPRKAPKAPPGLTLDQRVIGRNIDSWYYHCTIVGMATQTFYEVNFDDGSYCDNVHPENILVSVFTV